MLIIEMKNLQNKLNNIKPSITISSLT